MGGCCERYARQFRVSMHHFWIVSTLGVTVMMRVVTSGSLSCRVSPAKLRKRNNISQGITPLHHSHDPCFVI